MLAQGLTTIDLMLQKLILDAERVLPDAQTIRVTDKLSRAPSKCKEPSRQIAEADAAVQPS